MMGYNRVIRSHIYNVVWSKSSWLGGRDKPNQNPRRVNVDFPSWMVDDLDREARRLGVTRQSIIKVWLSERLEQAAANKRA